MSPAEPLLKIEAMSEHSIVLRLRKVRRARVRYGRANLYVARWGNLTSGELGPAIRAFERGEGGVEAVCWAFVQSRIESHTASFDFERADLGRLVGLVTAVADEPKLRSRTVDGLAGELVDLAAAERERTRRRRADLKKLTKSYFDSSALGVLDSVQATLGKLKFGSMYEPQMLRFSSPLADSVSQLAGTMLGRIEPPNYHLGLAHAKAPAWARALKASEIAQQAALAISPSITALGSAEGVEGHIASLGVAPRAGSKSLKLNLGIGDGIAPPWLGDLRCAGLASDLQETLAAIATGFSPPGLKGRIASLGVAAAGDWKPSKFGFSIAAGDAVAPPWLGALRSAGLAPDLQETIAKITAGFSYPGLQDRIASLGITAQIGDLKLGASLSATLGPKDLGFAALAQRQLGQLPHLPAWRDWADSFERSLPANWRGLDAAEVDRAAGLMGETGLCLAWVPRAELVRALLAAPDHQARCQILVANTNEILADTEAVLAEVESEDLAPIAVAAEEAIRSARAGAPGPAQSHVASALGHIAHGYFGYDDFGPVRKRFADVDPVNDVGFAEFSFYAIGRAWVISIAGFKQAGDGFNRNLTAHFVGAPHYSDANLLAGLMLLAGLARELQRQERRMEARRLQAA